MAKGRKTGGRTKGVRNKATEERLTAIAKADPKGVMPKDFLLAVSQNEGLPMEVRIDAATKAAPYWHPKLAQVDVAGKDGGPIQIQLIPGDDKI